MDMAYGDDFKVFPAERRHPVRGVQLSKLYGSADVVVGDSIFAGTPLGRHMDHICAPMVVKLLLS